MGIQTNVRHNNYNTNEKRVCATSKLDLSKLSLNKHHAMKFFLLKTYTQNIPTDTIVLRPFVHPRYTNL